MCTRKGAKALGLPHYQGRACPKGHQGLRYTSSGGCVECRKEAYNENRDANVESAVRWNKENRERRKEIQTLYRERNRETLRAKGREYIKTPRGRAVVNSNLSRRRAAKMRQSPSWASDGCVANFYVQSQWISKVTGVQYHVDHIVPLQGEDVRGLHVQNNLRIIPAEENYTKGNRYAPHH